MKRLCEYGKKQFFYTMFKTESILWKLIENIEIVKYTIFHSCSISLFFRKLTNSLDVTNLTTFLTNSSSDLRQNKISKFQVSVFTREILVCYLLKAMNSNIIRSEQWTFRLFKLKKELNIWWLHYCLDMIFINIDIHNLKSKVENLVFSTF